MQYLGDLLVHTNGEYPTPGLFVEYNYKKIVLQRHSPQFILTLFQKLDLAQPLTHKLPRLCCVIARPLQMPEPEQCIDIIETTQDESIRAVLAALLSGLHITRPRKILKTKKGFYDPVRGTLMGQELPKWADQYIKKQYEKTTREKDPLFLEEPSKEHIHRAALKVKAEIQRIYAQHHVDIETVFRYKAYWTRSRPDRLHYVGTKPSTFRTQLQKILQNKYKQQTNM
jgi:hypothetical protein